jgi:hypothetical protein
MSKQDINIGLQGNDGTGDAIREAFRKVNENFSEIYGVLGLTNGVIGITSLSDWTPSETFKPNGLVVADGDGYQLLTKTIEGEGGVDVTVEAERIVVSSQAAKMYRDPSPTLGGPLNADQGIARVPNIDLSTNYGQDIVTAFNNTHLGESVTTTVRELAVNKAYVDDNFIQTFEGIAVDAIRVRDEPILPQTTDPDYDAALTGNWVSTEVLPRKSVVRRQGDTMEGLLTLHDHPNGLAGLGTPQGEDDLQAATKFYVDKSSWASQVNLFVSTSSGDDTQSLTPPGKEGRHWNYAYKSVGAAALAAENLINLANFEPGPYKQSIIYTISPETYFSTVYDVEFLNGNIADSGYTGAYNLLKNNKEYIRAEVIAYINTKYVNKLDYNPDTCQRDVRLILDAVGNDLVLGTNYNSVLSARQYYQVVAQKVINAQLIQTIDGINYAKNIIQNYSYSETICKRDTGLIIDAIGNDLILGSNFQTVRAGVSYYQASATNVVAYELEQTIGALEFVKTQLLDIESVSISSTIITNITNYIDTIINIIQNGVDVAPDFELPESPYTPDGATSARDLLLGNIPFIQAEVIGYLSANYPTLAYSKETCKRDAKFMVQAVVYDIMYGGNTASFYAGGQYYGYGGGLEIASTEVVATIDAIGYIKTLAKKVVANLTPDTVYQQTYRQYKNSGLTNGNLVDTTIDTLFNLISEVVANGTGNSTELAFDITGLDPDLLTAQADIQSNKETIKTDTITFINDTYDVINDSNAVTAISTSFGTITNVLDNGLDELPAVEFTYPDNIIESYADAAALIQDNYDFIKDEVIGFIASAYPSFTYNGDPLGSETCARDVQYAIEGTLYDLIYGGNSASTFVGQQYYAKGILQLPTEEEKTITLDAFIYAQLLCTLVATNTTPSNIYSLTSQTKNLSLNGSAAIDAINEKWNRILFILENGLEEAVEITYPTINSTIYTASFVRARTVIQNNKYSIAQSVTDYLDVKYAGGFSYDEGICFRDLGYLVNAAALDVITGGTYQSVNAGKSYYRNTSAKSIAIGTQYTETLDAIEYAKVVTLACLNQVATNRYQTVVTPDFSGGYIPSTAAKNYVSANWDIVTNIIKFGYGAAPTPSFGTGTVQIRFTNGGNGYVDQGSPTNTDLIPGKILIGSTSGGNATIVSYTQGGGSPYDTIIVRLLQPIDFQEEEQLLYAETVKDLQITIFVESGIYYEDYPIRLSQNVSIKGNDFRRTIIRPRDRASQSPWRKIFFFRDAVLDGMELGEIDRSLDYATNTTVTLSGTTGKIQAFLGSGAAPRDWIGRVLQIGVGKAQIDSVANNLMNCSTIYPFSSAATSSAGEWHIYKPNSYGRHYLTDPNDINSPAKNNKLIDVFLCNDATRVNNLSMQGHGGFAMVLDPEGQILSKSPYGQVCSSFSGSLNTKRFAGGQFVDGFAGRLKGTITEVDGYRAASGTIPAGYTEITVKGGANSGLDVRAPKAPSAFFWQGFRYQINNILSYDSANSTVVLGLSKNTPWPYTISFAYDQDKCARDVGLILDAVTYDLVTGSNYQAYKAGLSYLRSYSSSVTTLQKSQTIYGVDYARDLAIAVTPTYSSTITTEMGIITDIIDNGETAFDPADLDYPNPVDAAIGYTNAKNVLIANRDFIRAEIVAWIDFYYNTSAIPNYDAEVCSRDVGYVVDAVVYDLLYGGNSQTIDAARAYYNAAGSTTIAGEQTVTGEAYGRLKAIMKDIAQNISVSITSGNAETQVSGSAGSLAAGQTASDLVDIIISVVKNGLSAAPTVIEPTLTRTISGVAITGTGGQFSCTATTLFTGQAVTISGIKGGSGAFVTPTYSNPTTFYIIATDGSTTFTLSNSYGGSAITTTAGTLTGLTFTVTRFNSALHTARNAIELARSTIQLATIAELTSEYGAVYNINIEMGGNKSMLANDFAMVNDLGYGIVAGNGALTEQVSTFTYYCHTHYWAFNGGQIRSVAGSNAHGVYGLRATGYDVTELPDAVTLSNNLTQVAKVYKIGTTASQMNEGDQIVYISNYDYIPQNISQLEIDFSVAGKSNTRYEVTSLGHTPYYTEASTSLAAVRNPVKSGTGPYYVTYTIATQTAPTLGVYYTVSGNSNKNYNGNYLCTSSTTTSITLRYTEDPGTAGTTGFQTANAANASGIVTVTFAGAPLASVPFSVDQTIYVKGVSPSGYNGVFTVTECTTSYVKYAGTASGSQTIAGIVSSTFVNAQNVIQLNLGTSGNNNTSSTGLASALYHQQNVVIQALQYFKFDDIANVNPTRPSTALQFDDNLADIYRIIAYNLVESTGETLTIQNGAGQSVLSSDTSFNYYKVYSDPARISTVDPIDGTKTMGLNLGDVRIAVSPISSASTIAQLNKGTYITALGGRSHRVLSYTDTTGSTFTTSTVSGDGVTATITFAPQALAPFAAGSTITVVNVSPTTYNGTFTVITGDVDNVTFASTAIGSQVIAGTIYGGGVPAFLLLDSKPVKSTSQSYSTGVGDITISSMRSKVGIGPYYVTYNIPSQAWPIEIDQYMKVSGNVVTTTATASSSADITVTTTRGLAVGSTITFAGVSFGGISTSTTYYITKITTSNSTIQISTTKGGSASTFSATTGTLTITTQGAADGNYQVAAGISLNSIVVAGDGANATITFGDIRAASTATAASSSSNKITLASANSHGVGEKIEFTAVTQSTTATATVNATITMTLSSISSLGVLTVGATAGTVAVGMMLSGGSIAANTVWITANISGSGAGSTWQTNTTTAQSSTTITGTTNLITIGSSTGMVAGETITFAGTTIGSLVAGNYYIKQIISATQISVSSTYNGANFGVGNASGGSMTVTAGSTFSNITAGTTYYIASIVDNQITISASSTLSPVLTLTDGAGSWTTAAGDVPFPVGSIITIKDIVPAGYNGNYVVTASSNSSVTYASTQTGTASVQGSVAQGSITNTDRVTLIYPTDPGIYANGTTKLSIPSTGIDKPLSTSGSYTFRVGYAQGATAQITVKISTTRATGHDFLDIGTGGYNTTNYPYQIYGNPAQSATGYAGEVYEEGVGRVFHVSTDQFGIFRVGRFFTVDQGTGTVTFSASIALSNLDGIGFKRGVTVSEFSTDSTMTNNASEIVPVQSAVRGYIDRRLGIDHGGTAVSSTNLIGKGYLSLGGDLAMKGNLNMASHLITNVTDPSNDQDAATKLYVDVQVARFDQLNELRDTSISGVANGDFLIYDTVASAWKNITNPAGTASLATTNAVGNGSTVTLSFATQVGAPFAIGQTIIVTGVSPSQYNGIFTVSNVTSATVQYSSTAAGTYVSAGTIIGNQVNVYYSTTSGKLTTSINTGAIVDSAVSSTAAINQIKMSFDGAYASLQQITGVTATGNGSLMTFVYASTVTAAFTAGQRIIISGMSVVGYNNTWTVKTCNATTITIDGAITGSGTGGTIKPLGSTASFDTANFTVSGGWVGIKSSSIQLSQIVPLASGRILGNFSGVLANPISETAQAVFENGVFQKHGSTVGAITNGSGGLASTTITKISVASGEQDALVKTDSSAFIDVSGIKIGTNAFIGINGSTIELTSPGNTTSKILTLTGSAANNSIATLIGTLKAIDANSSIQARQLYATGTAATDTGTITGTWTISSSSSFDFASNNCDLKTRKLSTTSNTISGTITGDWGLASGAKLTTSLGTLIVKDVTVAASGNVDFATNNATLTTKSLTTGGTTTVGYITGDWQLNAGSKMQATYADLAEFYSADQEYETGTVLVFGGDAEVTTTTVFGDTRVAGVVSENPAYTMNASLQGTRACLALQGRVPVKVLGTVKKGDLLTTAARAGYACKAINPQVGTIIGKALADKTDADVGIVEVAVGRL